MQKIPITEARNRFMKLPDQAAKHEILAEYESARDADLTFRNLIARIPDGVTILNPTKKTIEVTL